jgi:hypothetical protein
MRKLIALTALLLLPLALAAPAHALDEDDGDGTDASIPDYVYAGPFEDNSQIPDSPKRTTFKLAGKDTITATTWYTAWNGRTLRLVASYPRYPQKQRLPLVHVFHGAGGRAVEPMPRQGLLEDGPLHAVQIGLQAGREFLNGMRRRDRRRRGPRHFIGQLDCG